MTVYVQPTLPHFDIYWHGFKYKKMEKLEFTHIPDEEELEAIFQQHIDRLKDGNLTAEELENLKTWCCLGFKLKAEIATDHWISIYKFRERLEGILRMDKPKKEVAALKKKIEALVKDTWN